MEENTLNPQTDETLKQAEQAIQEQSSDWYTFWRNRIHDWVNQQTDQQVANLILLVPDLFALLVGLTKDRRVPVLLKAQLVIAATYVLSPMDFIPEVITGVVGLTDDMGVLAIVLLNVQRIAGLDPTILREHWKGEGEPKQVIEATYQKIVENADKIFNKDIWEKILKTFRSPKPVSEDTIESLQLREPLDKLNFLQKLLKRQTLE